MPYQLPQELQTTKLNSLTGDARSLADEIIADKFGIGEVVSKTVPRYGYSDEHANFGETASASERYETLRVYVVFSNARPLTLALPLSTHDSFEYRNKSAYVCHIVEKIQNEVLKYEDGVNALRNMRLSFGRSDFIARGYNDIYEFIYSHFRDTRGVS